MCPETYCIYPRAPIIYPYKSLNVSHWREFIPAIICIGIPKQHNCTENEWVVRVHFSMRVGEAMRMRPAFHLIVENNCFGVRMVMLNLQKILIKGTDML